MAKRLTEEDIRRIFREEAEREKRKSKVSEEAKATLKRLNEKRALGTNVGGLATPGTKVCEVDWGDFVQRVIDTYWEVVEEDLNEPDQA